MTTDPFAEQMLDSTMNEDKKNVSTRSIILAPFNSTRSNINEVSFEQKVQIKEYLADRKILKFNPKVKEVDRQYEMNNNADLDNGVYHQDDESREKESQSRILDSGISMAGDIGKNHLESQLNEKTNEWLLPDPHELGEENKSSDWKHLQRQMMGNKGIGIPRDDTQQSNRELFENVQVELVDDNDNHQLATLIVDDEIVQ